VHIISGPTFIPCPLARWANPRRGRRQAIASGTPKWTGPTPWHAQALMSEQARGPLSAPVRSTLQAAPRLLLIRGPGSSVEHLIDGHYGRGSTHWASARPNATERIVLEFDRPSRSPASFTRWRVSAGAHAGGAREVSSDQAAATAKCSSRSTPSARKVRSFSTRSCDWNSHDHPSELTIVPNKSGSGVATLTALRLFA